jgi:hypothetical protein
MRRLALALCLLLVTASSEGAEVPLPASLRPGDHRAPINGAVGKRDFVEEPAAFARGIRTFLKSLP